MPARATANGRLPDFYEVLQVSPQASQEVIQAAYRALARAYHPDVNSAPGTAERMRRLNVAFATLNDPARRAAYNIKRTRASRQQAAAERPGPDPSRNSGARSSQPSIQTTTRPGQQRVLSSVCPPRPAPARGGRLLLLTALSTLVAATVLLGACGLVALMDDTPTLPASEQGLGVLVDSGPGSVFADGFGRVADARPYSRQQRATRP